MKRELKRQMIYYTNPDLIAEVDKACEEDHMTKSQMVRLALREYLDKRRSRLNVTTMDHG